MFLLKCTAILLCFFGFLSALPRDRLQTNSHHLHWVTNHNTLSSRPILFTKACPLDNNCNYDWLRHTDNALLSKQADYFFKYVFTHQPFLSNLYLFEYDWPTHAQLSSYEPTPRMQIPTTDIAHRDIFTLIAIETRSITLDINETQVNATCNVDFLMPVNTDDAINEGILAEMNRLVHIKMTLAHFDQLETQNAKPSSVILRTNGQSRHIVNTPFAHEQNVTANSSLPIRNSAIRQIRLSFGPITAYRQDEKKHALFSCAVHLKNPENPANDFRSKFYTRLDSAPEKIQYKDLEQDQNVNVTTSPVKTTSSTTTSTTTLSPVTVTEHLVMSEKKIVTHSQPLALGSEISEDFKRTNNLHFDYLVNNLGNDFMNSAISLAVPTWLSSAMFIIISIYFM